MDKKFIMVNSAKEADQLINQGFRLVNHAGDQWFFLNDNKLIFSEKIKVVYTDILSI